MSLLPIESSSRQLRRAAFRAAWGLALLAVSLRVEGFDLCNDLVGALVLLFALRRMMPLSGGTAHGRPGWPIVASVVLVVLAVFDLMLPRRIPIEFAVILSVLNGLCAIAVMLFIARVCQRQAETLGARWWRAAAALWCSVQLLSLTAKVLAGPKPRMRTDRTEVCLAVTVMAAMVAVLFIAASKSGTIYPMRSCPRCRRLMGLDPSNVCEACQRCPQCDYPLAGLAGPRCPECGAKLTRGWLESPAAGPADGETGPTPPELGPGGEPA